MTDNFSGALFKAINVSIPIWSLLGMQWFDFISNQFISLHKNNSVGLFLVHCTEISDLIAKFNAFMSHNPSSLRVAV